MSTKYKIYQIPNYQDYELHYNDEVQLVYSKKSDNYLKIVKTQKGYLQVGLSKNGKQKWFKIHRLVWLCLKGDIPQDLQINHIDEVKTNNSIENLELVTPKQNSNHGTRNARVAKANKISMIGNQNGKANSIPIVGIKKDLLEILQYPSAHEAERDVDKGFNQGNISFCCQNKRKSHKDYYWFYQQDFEEYMNRFNNNLQDVIKYKSTLTK